MTAQQLKNSILQMAVQGKLVPQDPADEPASILLKKIKAEKDALIKSGKIKRDKHESVITRDEDGHYFEKIDGKRIDITDEIPFDIPEGWEWTRICSISSKITDGEHKTPPREKDYSGFYLLSARNILNSELNLAKVDYVSQKTYAILSKRCSPQIGDILLSCSGSVGRCCICTQKNCVMVRSAALISPIQISAQYLQYAIQSNAIQMQILEKKKKVAQANLFQAEIKSLYIPLPPLVEQKRIVAKIEELLPHIEEYGKAETELSKLNAELLEQLKKSILQSAIQGKLIPQDPTDEPASELLKRIKAEKNALIKSGKLKRDKHESVITRDEEGHFIEKKEGKSIDITDEIPFDVPETWEWVRLGAVFQHNTGKALNSSNRTGQLLEYITTSNLYWNRFELDKLRKMFFTDSELEKCTVQRNDLLVCEGGDFGRAAIWAYDYPMCIQNHIHRLRAFSEVCVVYFYYLFYYYKTTGLINGTGIGIKGLSSNVLHDLLFPLPPLAEQKRIIKRLETIFLAMEGGKGMFEN